VVTAPSVLRFDELDPGEFERLCQDVALAEGFVDVERYGRPGQVQHGIDFRGRSPEGDWWNFQVKRTEELTDTLLKKALSAFDDGPLAADCAAFVLCAAMEANDRKFQDELKRQRASHSYRIVLWDAVHLTHLLRQHPEIIRTYFGPHWVEVFVGSTPARERLDGEVLLLGPVAALGLQARVQQAEQLTASSPAQAAAIYQQVAAALTDRYPAHAARFQQRRAAALQSAGDPATSHDILMNLAVAELDEAAEPRVSSAVAHALTELHDEVDPRRQARGAAVIRFGRWHEQPAELIALAECFDAVGPDDEYAPFIAVLVVEAASADRNIEIVRQHRDTIERAAGAAEGRLALRLRVGLADHDDGAGWAALLREAEALRFPATDGTFVCLRGARWCAWQGDLDRAESLYRLAMKLGAETDLDLDVENALWSLTALYTLRIPGEDLFETNRLALSINGTRSYVPLNARTHQRAYQYIATGNLPDAHLWARHWLLESIRSGCLMAELESHAILARVFLQAKAPGDALLHGVIGGDRKLVEAAARQAGTWPEFLPSSVRSSAPWERQASLSAVALVGDMAPPEIAHSLIAELREVLAAEADDPRVSPLLVAALAELATDATEDELAALLPILHELAPRSPKTYRLTDPGVMALAAIIYRFHRRLRSDAANILAEMAPGAHTGDWARALQECGDETAELVQALLRVSERDELNFAGTLADLDYLDDETRALWASRLAFVEDYPLGPRSQHQLFARYDVPTAFLEEQGQDAVRRYLDKLVAIASDEATMASNRAAALAAAADVCVLLPDDRRKDLFDLVRPLAEESVGLSEMDQFQLGSQHALSRFRIALGGVAELRQSAAWFLVKSAADDDRRAAVADLAARWLRSDDPALQRTGASVLTDPSMPASVAIGELSLHTNQWVRRASLKLLADAPTPDLEVLERLAADEHRNVRIGAVHALAALRPLAPERCAPIEDALRRDPSAVVRAVAREILGPSELASRAN